MDKFNRDEVVLGITNAAGYFNATQLTEQDLMMLKGLSDNYQELLLVRKKFNTALLAASSQKEEALPALNSFGVPSNLSLTSLADTIEKLSAEMKSLQEKILNFITKNAVETVHTKGINLDMSIDELNLDAVLRRDLKKEQEHEQKVAYHFVNHGSDKR